MARVLGTAARFIRAHLAASIVIVLGVLGGVSYAVTRSGNGGLRVCIEHGSGERVVAGTQGANCSGKTFTLGARGPAGLRGPAGARGPRGRRGPHGHVGAAGVRGATGPKGPSGVRGATGPQGPTGPRGAAGPTGATGEHGVTGPAGPSEVFNNSANSVAVASGTDVFVLGVHVPVGSYLLVAKFYIDTGADLSGNPVDCRISDGSTTVDETVGTTEGSFAMSAPYTASAPTDLEILCTNSTPVTLKAVELSAIQTAAITHSSVTGATGATGATGPTGATGLTGP